MTPQELSTFSEKQLKDILSMSGEVLYSGAATLRQGDVYLLGHNPGGDANSSHLPTVARSLRELPTKRINSYLDTKWTGRATLQRRVIWLLERLGLNPRRVSASNLIFARSRDVASSQFERLADLCWPVHEQIIKIVQPRLVIVYGNSGDSPYSFLVRRFAAEDEEQFPSGHGNWMCRAFRVRDSFQVVGLPHLSRYAISAHPEVIDWILRLRSAVSVSESGNE